MIKLKKLNDVVVKLPKINKINNTEVIGKEIFHHPYNNIFISAYKNSGKSILIYNLLKYIDKRTKVYFFVPTFDKDSVYQSMTEYLDKRDIAYEAFDTIQNNLTNVIDNLQVLDDESPTTRENDNAYQLITFVSQEEKLTVMRKPKGVCAKYLFIFDDISNDLKLGELATFLKKNRHYKARVIISSQFIYDLPPHARSQIDNFILFPGIDSKRLEILYNSMDCSIPLETFLLYYKNGTAERYNFLYYDKQLCQFRKNFNLIYE